MHKSDQATHFFNIVGTTVVTLSFESIFYPRIKSNMVDGGSVAMFFCFDVRFKN